MELRRDEEEEIEKARKTIIKLKPCADIRPRINIFSFVSG